MQTPEGITMLPASYPEIVALLQSDELAAVETPIAAHRRLRILRDLDSSTTSSVQAEVSVSGMTVTDIRNYLVAHRDRLIAFGIRFLGDADATRDEQEYPEGEQQDPDGESDVLGMGVGFGVKYVIFHNFLANRDPAELRAFLKNRRIPKHTQFAKELARVFVESDVPFV